MFFVDACVGVRVSVCVFVDDGTVPIDIFVLVLMLVMVLEMLLFSVLAQAYGIGNSFCVRIGTCCWCMFSCLCLLIVWF